MHSIVLNSIVFRRSQLYGYVDIIQYNAKHKFVGVLDNPRKPSKEHVRTCKDYVIGREINIYFFGLLKQLIRRE